MANQSSQIITDLDASPVVKVNPTEVGGVVREAIATLAMTTGAAADVKRYFRIPSRARVIKLELANDDLDSNGAPTLATDIGLYNVAGGAVVDADFFASASTQLQAAQLVYQDLTYESAVVSVANRAKRIWEQLALATDPGVDYDVAFTYTTAAATHANGNATLRIRYVVDD